MIKEETIKRFKEIIRQTEVANECGLCTNDFSEEIETYNEILNLIQSQQEEINLNNEAEIALNNRIIDLEEELKKKDKIIDEMSLMISKLLANIDFEKKIIKEDIKTEELDCIKQYFEKKVEENDE